MAELKFPYAYHCPKCKAKLTVKKPEMVGKRLPCPSCKAKIEILTPDEDGHVAYDIGGLLVEKKTEEDFEEEREEYEERKRLERKQQTVRNVKWTFSLLFYLCLLGGTGFGYWWFIVRGYSERQSQKKTDDGGEAFGKLFDTK